MQTPSLAPIARAVTFFGFMGVAVMALTAAPAFQPVTDLSSTTVAQMRGEERAPDVRFAAVDPSHRTADRTKRAIATSQEANLRDGSSAIR